MGFEIHSSYQSMATIKIVAVVIGEKYYRRTNGRGHGGHGPSLFS